MAIDPIHPALTPRNAACQLLGCTRPIVLAGMGGVARSELVNAVTAAGGFGFLGMVREPVALIEQEVARVRAAGHQRFGVNIVPAATDAALLTRQLDAIIALEVPVVALFWDIDPRVVARLRDAGIVVVYQIGSVDEALTAERVGAQLLIAQGVEAGGHVRGVVPLRDLLPAVVHAVHVPVLAAGGLATGADLVTALALGAQGIVLGTALMATEESFAHPFHRQQLLNADARDTVLTDTFHINWPPHAPVRVLKSRVTALATPPVPPQVIGEEEGRPIYMFSTDSPLRSMTGDFAAMALYAGTGVGAITAIVPARVRLETLLADASAFMPRLPIPLAGSSSAVCYVGEMTGDYAGILSPDDIVAPIAAVLRQCHDILRLTLALRPDDPSRIGPPFNPDAAPLAGRLVQLHELSAEHHIGTADGTAPLPDPADIPATLHQQRQALAHGLADLVPRLPDSVLREALAELRRILVDHPEVATSPVQPHHPGVSDAP